VIKLAEYLQWYNKEWYGDFGHDHSFININ
jgi:hypothetical protein